MCMQVDVVETGGRGTENEKISQQSRSKNIR
jgi:hypothetical protein